MSIKEESIFELKEKFAGLETHIKKLYGEIEELQILTSKLLDVGVAISSEIDLYALLTTIIKEAKQLLRADRGTLYLVDAEKKELYFHVTDAQKLKEIRLPIDDKSIAGYVALTGKNLNIPDAYEISETEPYKFKKAIDMQHNYRTHSILTVPMLNHEGRITGVVQLINKFSPDNELEITSFNRRDERILMSLASQAAVSIENAQLYKEVEDLLRAFIRYSASAIDERDPATAGHSRRVALYSVSIAKAMNCFSEDEIKELEFAAWLHDVGKIGVREQVLVKENKLYPDQMLNVKSRFESIKLSLILEVYKKKFRLLTNGTVFHPDSHLEEGFKLECGVRSAECGELAQSPDANPTTEFREMNNNSSLEMIAKLDADLQNALQEVDDDLKFIEKVNKPGFLSQDDKQRIVNISNKQFLNSYSIKMRYLNDNELENLSVTKGNLNKAEWADMNSHVVKTYKILRQIPFTGILKTVPKIASGHHEKLDGSGYPEGLKEDDIPIQARILALADIYDALTAQDRPYKPAIPIDKSLNILEEEVKAKRLDQKVFLAFIENKIYNLYYSE